MSENLRLKATWVFRGILLLITMAQTLGIFWVRAEIKKELSGYVTKEEFATYQQAHERWGDEVVKNLRASIERIEAKLDRVIEKRP